ncbi:hypothetical protein HATV-3_gp51 [Haloarcula tailed virus 3]|uniref:Uncharacterized protein n=1 Tax=Haloarcula tailed virus 3 TaxID=2877990 RepID=A0AAE8XZK1_9CAUD|nr:hypothetical protein M1M35_gp51 [Haloarcula tailed virus 3]UBF23401.1 hypothetical protein HATV-3_gp51 [Haloarcula tailed virus 3]
MAHTELGVMALHCNHENCDGATSLQDTTERDENVLVEKYECEFGHVFHETVSLA